MKFFKNIRKQWRYSRGYGASRRTAMKIILRNMFRS